MTVSNQQIKEVIQAAIREAREITEETHTTRTTPLNPDTRQAELDNYRYLSGELREALARSDFSAMGIDKRVSRLLEGASIQLDTSSPEFKQACTDYAGGQLEVLEVQRQLLNGQYKYVGPICARHIVESPTPSGKSPTITAELANFLDERKSSRKIGDSAADGYRSVLAEMTFILGEIPADEINYQAVTRLIVALRQLSKNRLKKPAYKDKTFVELAALGVPTKDIR